MRIFFILEPFLSWETKLKEWKRSVLKSFFRMDALLRQGWRSHRFGYRSRQIRKYKMRITDNNNMGHNEKICKNDFIGL
jgi:hypothetical protein